MPRSKEANTIIRVPEDLAGKRPAVLADAMLREMCKKVVENRWTPLSVDQLAGFVNRIAELESVEHIKPALANYLKK
jgi:hypothetical protein